MAGAVIEQAKLRRVFGAFPSGVTAVAALIDGEPVGLAASSFTSVSLDPPLVSVCVGHSSTTWPVLRVAERIGLSVLAAAQQRAGRQLAARGVDRFAEIAWRTGPGGSVLLEGACAWIECSIEKEIPAGDHDIVLLRVHDLEADHEIRPLIFHASQLRGLDP